MIRLLFFFLAMWSPWTNVVDSAFKTAAARCGTCHIEGYSVQVTVGVPGSETAKRFDSEADAKDWAYENSGCKVRVTFYPKAGGSTGTSSWDQCS